MKTVAETINEYLNSSDKALATLVREARVERNFLDRLRRGERPPRQKVGRVRAKADDRYRRIARAMKIDEDDFCALVSSEQVNGARVVEVPVLSVQYAVDRLGSYALRGEGAPEERDNVRSQLQRIVKALEPT